MNKEKLIKELDLEIRCLKEDFPEPPDFYRGLIYAYEQLYHKITAGEFDE